MKLGTKSLLFGVHSFWCHPFFVALAWWRLYGFPSDYRLWVCFFLHDIGYWGCAHMDDADGERHPVKGAWIVHQLFGLKWGLFCQMHSRFLARSLAAEPSQLCWADKLAFCTTPKWLYMFQGRLTGEVYDYMVDGSRGEVSGSDLEDWYHRTYYRMLRITVKGARKWKQTTYPKSRGSQSLSATTH
jgi:hypothetical protein